MASDVTTVSLGACSMTEWVVCPTVQPYKSLVTSKSFQALRTGMSSSWSIAYSKQASIKTNVVSAEDKAQTHIGLCCADANNNTHADCPHPMNESEDAKQQR
jgi:hypothetical protein